MGGGGGGPIFIPTGGGSSQGSGGGSGGGLSDLVAAQMLANMSQNQPKGSSEGSQNDTATPTATPAAKVSSGTGKTGKTGKKASVQMVPDGEGSLDEADAEMELLEEDDEEEEMGIAPSTGTSQPKRRTTGKKTAVEEVDDLATDLRSLEDAPGPPPPWAEFGDDALDDQEGDLLTVAMLASWMEQNLERLGQERLKSIIDIYSSMGGLSDQLREILEQFIDLDEHPGDPNNIPVTDYLTIIAEMDNIMYRSRSDRPGAALLSMLLNRKQVDYEARASRDTEKPAGEAKTKKRKPAWSNGKKGTRGNKA